MKSSLWIIATIIILFGAIIIIFEPQTKDQSVKNSTLKLTSPAFDNGNMIPVNYTCQGQNINPPLEISGVPPQTKSLVLVMDDPDSSLKSWTHWIVYSIPPETNLVQAGVAPGVQGVNSWSEAGYGGPCPPSGQHRYVFKLYALDISPQFIKTPTRSDLETLMKGHILDQTQLTGLYSKK